MNFLDEVPREMGDPKRKLVKNREEFYSFVNNHLNVSSTYTTVYHFKVVNGIKVEYGSAVVDKIFVDIDGFKEFDRLVQLHNEFLRNDIMHCIHFSGGGFHFYVFVKVLEDASPSQKSNAIRKWVEENFKDWETVDKVVIGDLARLTRVPNTYNFKRGLYCIPVTHDDLIKGLNHILEKARSQSDEFEFFGEKRVELKVEEINETSYDRVIEGVIDINNGKFELFIEFPPFLQKIIDEKKNIWYQHQGGWRKRTLIILYLKERGFSLEQVIKFLKNNLTREEFIQCVLAEKQPFYIFRRDNSSNPYYFPNIEKLVEEGFQITEEDVEWFNNHPLYFKLGVVSG